jgi:hypothetical protein
MCGSCAGASHGHERGTAAHRLHYARRVLRTALLVLICAGCACSFDPRGGSGGGGDDDPIDSSVPDLIDADPAAPDAEVKDTDGAVTKTCATVCPGTCDELDVCHITCGGDGDDGGDALPGEETPPPCEQPVVCPAGFDCHVHCEGRGACEIPIDCSQASNCRIDCSRDNSCSDQLTCGAGLGDINCLGSDSCRGGIECQDACRCEINCEGDSTCEPEALCPPGCDEDNDCRVNSGSGCEPTC